MRNTSDETKEERTYLNVMAKVGRNEPCSCSSGLKFKYCHGSVVSPAHGSGNLPLTATTTTARLMGFPGQHQDIHIVNRFKEGDTRNSIPIEGIPGPYQVRWLSRSGLSLVPERNYSFSGGLEGDSHLAITMVMNHLIHHRTQLGVFLRLNDVMFPGMYGPSADEKF